jgi:hypothetical protein
MRNRPVTTLLALALLFVLPLLALSQTAPQNLMLNLNGQQSQVPVTQMNGRSYVEVTALARAANGTLSFQGNKMLLTVPGSGAVSASTAAAAPSSDSSAPPANPGFSKDFMRAGIEAMAAIREWRSVLNNGVANGYPIASLGLPNYRAQAQQAVRLATVAANTDSDRSAAQLVTNEFENMKRLSDKISAKAASLSYIDPDEIKNDPLDQQIITCARSLAAMASSGQFVDDGSCH